MNPWKVNRYRRNLRENLSVTNVLLIIQIAVYLLMTLAGGSTNAVVLVRFGAKFSPYIQVYHQYWRFITPIFVHIGIEHIVMNSIFLYYLGGQMERMIGSWRFLAIYLLSGVMGNVASFAFGGAISAGASTSLFGLFGMIIYLSRNHSYVRYFRALGMQYAALIVLNIVMGFINGSVDNFGHIGGLVGGYLATALISFKGDRQTTAFQRGLAAVAYIAGFIFCFTLGMNRRY